MDATLPRQPRIDLPGIPQHIVQQGNDRQPTFFADADRLCYLTDLNEIALRVGCHVHATVLVTNPVHLLATPTERGQIARVMQSLGRRCVRYINDRYHRIGTLREGRVRHPRHGFNARVSSLSLQRAESLSRHNGDRSPF